MTARTAIRAATVVGAILAATVVGGCASPTPHSPGAPVSSASSVSAAPRFAPGGPDADDYGARDSYPVRPLYGPRFYVGNFSHYDQFFDSRVIRRAPTPSPLAYASPEPVVRYAYQSET